MNTIEQIQANSFYQQILKDAYGGIIFDVANRNKYDAGKTTLLELWNKADQESAGGIMKGAMAFLSGK